MAKFIEMHTKNFDWIRKAYHDHERKTKPGTAHPMRLPEQYLRTATTLGPRPAEDGIK